MKKKAVDRRQSSLFAHVDAVASLAFQMIPRKRRTISPAEISSSARSVQFFLLVVTARKLQRLAASTHRDMQGRPYALNAPAGRPDGAQRSRGLIF